MCGGGVGRMVKPTLPKILLTLARLCDMVLCLDLSFMPDHCSEASLI